MAIVGPVTSLVLGFVSLWLAGFIGGPLNINPVVALSMEYGSPLSAGT
jgi:hypothetical protein